RRPAPDRRGGRRSGLGSDRARRRPRERGGGQPLARSRELLPRLWLGRAGETMFPPRAPFFFFWARLGMRAVIGTPTEDFDPGNLPVPHNPLRQSAHADCRTSWMWTSTAATRRPVSRSTSYCTCERIVAATSA